jgi:N-acetylglutamate synthase-like GNAT family acetyltransferase
MEMNPLHFRRAAAADILPLRHAVLRAGLPITEANFDGDDAEETFHIKAVDGEKVVGCATLMLNPFGGEPACQLRGMAVDPAYQRHGVGRTMLRAVDLVAKSKGIKLLWANARCPAVPFYKKYGWNVVSEEFDIPTAGLHFKITRRL